MTSIPKIDQQKFGTWAIVTGASSGIGKEFARQLAHNGLNLVLIARRKHLLESLGQELANTYHIDYRVVDVDLTTDHFLSRIIDVTQHLDIGLLISNAGTGNPGAFLKLSHDRLHQSVRLNVLTHLALVHHFGQRFAQRGQGGMVLVAAMGAINGIPYMANDAATKSYMISLARGLNAELKDKGISITALLPGPTQTDVIAEFGFEPEAMPMKPMSVEQCVAEGLIALNANKTDHLTGRLNRVMNQLIPSSIMRRMLGTMISKGVEHKQHLMSAEVL